MTYDTLRLKGMKYVLIPEVGDKAVTNDVPALPFADASIARNIVSRREAAGLSQRGLAEAAGIRVEILNRAERGVTAPSVRTLAKIEQALSTAGRKAKRRK